MLAAWTLPISFDQPAWLWLLTAVPVIAVVSWRTLRGLEPVRRVLAIALRVVVLALVACCLADIQYVKASDKLTVIFLMDRSDSVKTLQDEQETYLQQVGTTITHADDQVGMIDFARGAFLEQLPMAGGYHIQPGRLPEMENRDRTNVAAAMRLAMAMFPSDTGKRIVLMSDGNDNMGDVLAEAAAAQAQGVAVDVVPLWYAHDREVYFDRIVAPARAEDGDLVGLRMLLHAEAPARGRIDIYQNGRLVQVPEQFARVSLTTGNNPFVVKLPVKGGGPQRFEARFVPDEGDSIEENNVATAFTFVGGKTKVLLLSTDLAEDAPLIEALASEKIDADVRDVSAEPVDLLDLLQYATVILSNVPANTLTEKQHQALVNYVNNLGGGLIMIGGDDAFGAGGWIGSPVARVMPVSFEIKHKKVIPRGALVLIMHSCEIPRGNYWGTRVAKKSVDTISSRDYIGILAYSFSPSGVNWEVPLQLATNKRAIKARIDRMSIGDMPDFQRTMRMGVDRLLQTDAAQKHMIIISDGDPSAPNPGVIRDMVNAKITCSTVGIGYGAHVVEQTLRNIAQKTGGRFYPCRNPRALPQIFVKESKVVRRPLISEEPFQPQLATGFSEMLAGLDLAAGVPPLGGMVLTQAKPEAVVPLVRPGKDGDDPVLAYWQAGLGKSVAFTSGLWRRWGAAWVSWPGFSKLWAQVVRWSLRQDAPANLDIFTRVEGDVGHVVVDAVDVDAGALNMLNLPAVIIKPDATTAPLVFNQTGPGRYEAAFTIDQTGQYIANVAVREQDQFKGSIQTGVSVPFSPEFRALATNEALLREVVRTTGGRWHDDITTPQTHRIFSHDFPPIVAKRPIWNWTLAWLLLPLFLLDVAIRRLASWLAFSIAVEGVLVFVMLFGVGTAHGHWWGVLGTLLLGELVGWSIRYRYIAPAFDFLTHSVTALGHAGARSAASLDHLKDTRKRVRDDQPVPGGSGVPKGDTVDVPDASRRFDSGDETAASQPSADLTEALGGATADARPDAHAKPHAQPDGQDETDTTSRLLKAKRRARRDMGGDKPPNR